MKKIETKKDSLRMKTLRVDLKEKKIKDFTSLIERVFVGSIITLWAIWITFIIYSIS